MRYHIKQLPRDLSFDKGFFVCLRALQLLTQHNRGCVIVGVAGAPSSMACPALHSCTPRFTAGQSFMRPTAGHHACLCSTEWFALRHVVQHVVSLRPAMSAAFTNASAGASGSGKTTFTTRLKKMLANIAVISLDMYNDGSKVLENNFDDPRIIDFDTLMRNIQDLRAGKPTKVPIYDFKISRRVGYEDVEVPKSRIIIIEGIHALSSKLEALLDLRIAITGGIHFDLVKRVRCPCCALQVMAADNHATCELHGKVRCNVLARKAVTSCCSQAVLPAKIV